MYDGRRRRHRKHLSFLALSAYIANLHARNLLLLTCSADVLTRRVARCNRRGRKMFEFRRLYTYLYHDEGMMEKAVCAMHFVQTKRRNPYTHTVISSLLLHEFAGAHSAVDSNMSWPL